MGMKEPLSKIVESRYGGRNIPVALVLPDGGRVALSPTPEVDVYARTWNGLRALASPELIRPITNLLPLTFMNDALREISVQGATLWDVRTQILGLLVWTLIGFALAVRFFRFDRF